MKKKSNKRDTQASLDFIVKKMATKDDVREIVREEVPRIVRKELENAIREQEVATKDDIKGIVSTAHSRIDQELEKRQKLEVRLGSVEKHLGIKPPVGTVSR